MYLSILSFGIYPLLLPVIETKPKRLISACAEVLQTMIAQDSRCGTPPHLCLIPRTAQHQSLKAQLWAEASRLSNVCRAIPGMHFRLVATNMGFCRH